MKNALFLIAVSTTLAACAGETERLKLVSPLATSGTVSAVGQKVTGESCRRSILWVFSLEKDGSVEDAVANALEKVDGANALTDVKVTRRNLMTVLYNYRCVEVEGRVATVK